MKLALARGYNPNISEFTCFSALRDVGIEATLVAELSRSMRMSLDTLSIPYQHVSGLGTFLSVIPEKARPYARFLLEQKIGLNAPMGTLAWLDAYDVCNVSDLLTWHGVQIAHKMRHALPRKKLVVTLWGNFVGSSLRSCLGRYAAATMMAAADRYIAVSEIARATAILEGISPSLISVIPPAVDCKRFRPRDPEPGMRSRWSLEADDVVALFIGRLEWNKGVDHLVEAVALIRHEFAAYAPRLRVLVIGNGRMKDHLRRKIVQLGVSEHIVLGGAVPFDEIHQLYSIADFFVLPSTVGRWWQEQYGFVLIEAMASGVAVIATRSGAIPEVLGDTGLLVQPGNFRDLAYAIADLLVHEHRRRQLGRAGRKLVLERNDIPVIVPSLARFYERLF